MIKYSNLDENYISAYFPELKEQLISQKDDYSEFLPHIIFANIFARSVADLLMQEDRSKDDFIHRAFEMYEDLAANGDTEVKNLVQVSLLEYLWDEKTTYEKTKKLMGEHTREIWSNIVGNLSEPLLKS